MEEKSIKIFVATPGCGKSYLADKYLNCIDVDEFGLKIKYIIPEGISRKELESTKGNGLFTKRENYETEKIERISQLIESENILLFAPHPDLIEWLIKKKLEFYFVYPEKKMKEEIVQRFIDRGNSEKFIKENTERFDTFFQENISDTRTPHHIVLKTGQFLEDILLNMGFKLIEK